MNIKQILENSKLNKENIKYDVPMKEYTSFKIGGSAECLIKVQTTDEIQEILGLDKN